LRCKEVFKNILQEAFSNLNFFCDDIKLLAQYFPSKRNGCFSSVRELESSITTFLALRNAQPTRYVWSAKGEDILNKIQRDREAMASQA
jgi:hypothetical protein